MIFSNNRKKQRHIYIGAAAVVFILIVSALFIGFGGGDNQTDIQNDDTTTNEQIVSEEDLFFSYTTDRKIEVDAARADTLKMETIAQETLSVIEGDKDDALADAEEDVLPFLVDRDTITIGKGDTLAGLLNNAGIDRGRVFDAMEAMKDVFDPRNIRVDQDITVLYENKDGARHFSGFQFNPDRIRSIVVMEKFNGDFMAQEVTKELEEKLVAMSGTITSSLSVAGQEAGIPYSVLARLISVYSWDIDFQRDIREGDTFEIMYESFVDENGEQLKTGDILYANLTMSGRPIEIFQFELKDGTIDWFKRDGISVKRALMKTPINGARLSSGYGMRRHPVLGYNKMHKGLDFAAPTGTPIYASGNGVVEEAGRKGGYGNYVRIRHHGGLHTAYAHMHRIKVKKGQRVQQKDVIGTVGSTGRSTGPHLHYEVHINRKQVNPRRVDLPLGIKLEGTDRANFKVAMEKTDNKLADARKHGQKLAAIIKQKRAEKSE